MLPVATRVLADPEAVAAAACRQIGAAAAAAIRQRQVFRIVLAGGSTPRRTDEFLAATAQDWPAREVFWSDERCLPVDDGERNRRMAGEAGWPGWRSRPLRFTRLPPNAVRLRPLPITPGRSPAKPRSISSSSASAKTVVPPVSFRVTPTPSSPSSPSSMRRSAEAPKPPPARVSLGYPSLRACGEQLVRVTGAGKAEALAAWRRGVDLPIARAVRDDACLLVDATLRAAIESPDAPPPAA